MKRNMSNQNRRLQPAPLSWSGRDSAINRQNKSVYLSAVWVLGIVKVFRIMKISNFKPAWWLPGGHLQTLWANFTKREHSIKINRERLTLPDEDFVDLDWVESESSGPIVIVLHGLEGSIKSGYVRGMLMALKQAGFRAVLMNFRGCSGEHNNTSKAYHAGETGDFHYVVQTLHQRCPSAKMAAIGFSLGGNVLLKYLGETQSENPLSCAVAVSVPFLLNRVADRINKGMSRIYQRQLLSLLRKKTLDKSQSISLPIDVNQLHRIKDFWQFDHDITAKLYGFKSADDYYRKSSAKYYLADIVKPTLIVHALNDPFLYQDAIPQPQTLPAHVRLELSNSGGHVGFIHGGTPWCPRYWLEEKIPAYLKDFI